MKLENFAYSNLRMLMQLCSIISRDTGSIGFQKNTIFIKKTSKT